MEFNKDLNENKKESQLLRSELATFEHQAVELNNETLKEIMEDVINLEHDFRKLQNMDINENNFLRQQVQHLIGEKTKIEQSTLLLDTRVSSIEHEVGFEWTQSPRKAKFIRWRPEGTIVENLIADHSSQRSSVLSLEWGNAISGLSLPCMACVLLD